MSEIQSKSQLINYFNQGTKNKDQLLIGVEHEKFLFTGKERKRVNHEQISEVFKNLEIFGWKSTYEKENIIGLKRGNNK